MSMESPFPLSERPGLLLTGLGETVPVVEYQGRRVGYSYDRLLRKNRLACGRVADELARREAWALQYVLGGATQVLRATPGAAFPAEYRAAPITLAEAMGDAWSDGGSWSALPDDELVTALAAHLLRRVTALRSEKEDAARDVARRQSTFLTSMPDGTFGHSDEYSLNLRDR